MKKIVLMAMIGIAAVVGMIAFSGNAKAADPVMTLKWTTFEPDVPGASQDALKRFADQIDKKTEGRIKSKIYWGSVLGKAPDFLKMVGGPGVADVGFIVPTYHQWEIPLVAAAGLPFLTQGYKVAPKAQEKLYNEWSAMQEEMKKVNVKPLWFFQPHPHYLCMKEPIKSVNDLKGKKVWAAGFWQELATSLGIINVPMVAPDAYDAMQKGAIAGVFGNPYHTFKIFRYVEVAKYLYEWPFGGQPVNMVGINIDEWNKIAPNDQKAILEIAAGMQEWFTAQEDKEAGELKEFFEKQGCKHLRLPDEEYKSIGETGQKIIWSSWLNTAKQKNVPGEEWFTRYQAKVKEVSK